MPNVKSLAPYFEKLTGKDASLLFIDFNVLDEGKELGYSQFNEILLTFELSRINHNFFQFLVNGKIDYKLGSSIKSVEHLNESINRFIIIALLWFGNIKHAFSELSQNSELLNEKIYQMLPFPLAVFKKRHSPIVEITPIPAEKTYFLGYISSEEIQEKINNNPSNLTYKYLLKERNDIIKIGKENQTSYLISDHLDVYIATSMRLQHEFINVHQMVKSIFNHKATKHLNLRYFDPTQAYCPDRIDKGLSEALMLKRAKLTVYFVQENDTLGKDSELASTLAQGKPVIAFVPKGDKKHVDLLLNTLYTVDKEKTEKEIILEQLRIFANHKAWEKNTKVYSWVNDIQNVDKEEMKKELYKAVQEKYDKRAETLKHSHPLGIQVDLNSGVANGVLVVRTLNDCALLVRAVVLNKMKFNIKNDSINNKNFIYLEEYISKSIFRIQTGDKFLTNSFWNFYNNEI